MESTSPTVRLRAVFTMFTAALFLTSAWAADHEVVLHSFGGMGNAANVDARLVFDSAGNLYGTSYGGGLSGCLPREGCGTVFELSPQQGGGWTATVLHQFGMGSDGQNPTYGGVVLDSAGNLYGTTTLGGTHGVGTVFKLSPRPGGGYTETVLHSFGGARDGLFPNGGLVFDRAGNLYGTTAEGGLHLCRPRVFGCGTVFELSPTPGGGWTEKLLHNFDGMDGSFPFSTLIFDGDGNLYGTATMGGIPSAVCPDGCGTVFELSPQADGTWQETVLHKFVGDDGDFPGLGLVRDSAGNLYGTTLNGGLHFMGTVFELSPRQGGGYTETVLHSFGAPRDGTLPVGAPIMDASGNLYGTTQTGGLHDRGTVFKLSPRAGGGRTETVLHSFGLERDGSTPVAGLIFDAAGNLYGTTWVGGIHNLGTVFEVFAQSR